MEGVGGVKHIKYSLKNTFLLRLEGLFANKFFHLKWMEGSNNFKCIRLKLSFENNLQS